MKALKIIGITVGGFFALIVAISVVVAATGGVEQEAAKAEPTTQQTVSEKPEPKAPAPKPEPQPEPEPAEPEMTSGQENAVASAQDYLEYSGFSKQALIGQLSSAYGDDYPKADAVFAANHVDVDWNDEAVESAKDYLEYSAFSKDGLIDQLTSSYGDKYTVAQAQYAVAQVY